MRPEWRLWGEVDNLCHNSLVIHAGVEHDACTALSYEVAEHKVELAIHIGTGEIREMAARNRQDEGRCTDHCRDEVCPFAAGMLPAHCEDVLRRRRDSHVCFAVADMSPRAHCCEFHRIHIVEAVVVLLHWFS